MDWHRLPRDARNLIIYYTIATVDSALEFFFIIFMFTLGFSVEIVGILYTIYLLFILVFSIVFGYLIDFYVSPKYLIIIIDSIGIVAWIITSLATSPIHFLIVYMLDAAMAPFFVAYRSLERDLYPQDKLSIAYKYHMMFPYLSQAIATIIFGIVLEYNLVLVYRILCIIGAILSLILVLWTWKRIPATNKVHLRERKKIKFKISKALFFFAIAEILVIWAFNIAPFFVLDNYLFNLVGVGPLGIAIVYGTGAFLGFLGAITYGELEEKGSFTRITFGITLLSLGGVIVYLMNYIEYPLLLAIIAMILMYFGNSIWWIEHECFVMREVPAEVRGRFFGIIRTLRMIVVIPCPVIALYLIEINPLMPFLMQAVIMPFALPLYAIGAKLSLGKNRREDD